MASKRYIRNVIKSFKQVIPDAIGESLPGAKGLVDFIKNPAGEGSTVKEVFKEIVGDYKTEVDTVTGIFKRFKKSVKTGAFYDRDADVDMSAFGGDFSADLKDEDIFGDTDWDIDSSDASADVGGGTTNVNFAGSTDDGSNAGMISGAMAIGSARTVGAIEKGTAINFAVMNSIDSRLSRIEEANQKFFSANLELLSSIKSNIEAMAKIQGSKDTDLSVSQMERLFGDGSQEFNLRLYMRHISKKVKNNEFMSMLPMLGMVNPMNIATMELSKYAMKKIPLFATVEKMSKMLEGIGQLTLSNMANVKGNGMISKLFRFFGVKTTADVGKVSLGKMARGPVPFDGETKEAITRAIPGYLAKILNVMKHGKGAKDDTLEIYDNDQRQFRTAGEIRKKRKESEQYDMGEIRNFIEMCVTASGATGEDEAKVREQIFKIVSARVLSGKSFNDKDMFSSLSGKMKTIIQGVHHEKILNDKNKVIALEKSRFAYAASKQTEGYSDAEKMVEHAVTNDKQSKETLSLNDYFEKKNRPKIEELLTKLVGKDKSDKVLKEYKEWQKEQEDNKNIFTRESLDTFLKRQLEEANFDKLKETIDQINDRINGYAFNADLESRLNDIDISRANPNKIDNAYDFSDIKGNRARGIAEDAMKWIMNGPQMLAEKGDELTNKITSKIGFASGGYTGKGGKYEPAGIVHKGEWVANRELLKNKSAQPHLKFLEKLRLGLPGYAEGGPVKDVNEALGEKDLFLTDEGDKKKILKKRRKVYDTLVKLNVPFNEAVNMALQAQDDPEAVLAFIKQAKKDKKLADKPWLKRRGEFGDELVTIVRNDIVTPLKESFLGAKAAFKDGKISAKDILGKAHEMMPGVAKYAGVGLAAGFFLPGGPLLGAITGGAVGALKQNKALRSYFFGEKDENGETKKRGLFPKLANSFIKAIYGKEVGDKAENNLQAFFANPIKTLSSAWKDPQGRKMMIGAGAGGILGSMFGPGGAIIGAFAGGALGRRKQQSYFSKVLFGERVIGKDGAIKGYKGGLWQSLSGAFNALVAGPAQAMLVGGSLTDYKDMLTGKINPQKIRANLKKGLMNVGAGAAAGGLLGSFFGPGGTLIGALLGSTTGLRPVRAAAKRIMFGKENADTGKKEGGIFGAVRKAGTLAMALASFLAHGLDPRKHPFLSKIASVLGWTIGLPIKIAGGLGKLGGKILSPFRRWSTSSHKVLSGKALIDALNEDNKASSAEKAIGTGVGILVDEVKKVNENLENQNKPSTAEDAAKAEAANGVNTATEINDKKAADAEAKEVKKDRIRQTHTNKLLEGMKASLEEGNKDNKGILGTIASGVTSIISIVGGKTALDAVSNGFSKFGGKFIKGAGIAAVIGGAIGVGKGVYNNLKAENPEDKVKAADEGIKGAQLGAQGSALAKAGGILKGIGGFFKNIGSGIKAAAGKVKDGASALKNIFKEVKGIFPKLLSGLKLAKAFLKKAPLLGAFFVALDEILAIKKFADSGDSTKISPRQRIIALVRDSASAFASLIMLAIDGALLATGVGAAAVVLITAIDMALSFFSGESIADYVGDFIAKFLGGPIASVFGWTEEKEAAWQDGKLEEYEKKRHPEENKDVDVKAISNDVGKKAAATSKSVSNLKVNSTGTTTYKGNSTYGVMTGSTWDNDKFQELKEKHLERLKEANPLDPNIIEKADQAAREEMAAMSDVPGAIMMPDNPANAAPREAIDINNYDITKKVDNPFDYLKITGKMGNEGFNKLNDETKNDLAHLAKLYYNAYGEKLKISSGYRDPMDQERIWAEGNADAKHLANAAVGKRDGFTFKTNFPGTSAHELGNAIDVDNSDPKQIQRMFGYAPDDRRMVNPAGGGFKIAPDSLVGVYNQLKKKAGLRPMVRASGTWRNDKKDFNEHWHFQNVTDQTLKKKRWEDSAQARAKAVDQLDKEIKSASGGKKELSETVKSEYGQREYTGDKPQLIPGKRGSTAQNPKNIAASKKGEAGDSMDMTTNNAAPTINMGEITDLLKGILQAIVGLGSLGKDTNKTEVLKNLFIPASEAFNPNETAMSLVGSRLCVGL